jgi:hypothetical protein
MSKLTKTGRVAKTYNCVDCGEEFRQKSHFDKHKERKIPCILKDKPLKDIILETVKKEINKQIIINQNITDNISTTSEKNLKK